MPIVPRRELADVPLSLGAWDRRSAPPELVALAHRVVPELLADFPGHTALALRVGEALTP